MSRFFYANEYITVADSSALRLTGTNFTVAAWVTSLVSFTGSEFPRIFSKLSAATYNGWEILQYNDGTVYVQIANAGLLRTCFSSTVLTPGTQYLIAATLSSTTLKIYVNGVEENSNTHAGNVVGSNTGNALIGAWPGSPTTAAYKWTGYIHRVGAWSSAFSTAKILEMYETGRSFLDYDYSAVAVIHMGQAIKDPVNNHVCTDNNTAWSGMVQTLPSPTPYVSYSPTDNPISPYYFQTAHR